MKFFCCVLLVSASAVLLSAYLLANPSFETETVFLPLPQDAETEGADYEASTSPTFDGYPLLTGEANGLSDVRFVSAGASVLSGDAKVIGVSVGGEYRAYSIKALTVAPERHVINDMIGSKPVTVTYCDLSGCARVLTSSKHDALTIGVAGAVEFPQGLEMLLVVDGQKVLQKSEDMPCEDVPYQETTWAAWRSQHPDTLVYEGPEVTAVKPEPTETS